MDSPAKEYSSFELKYSSIDFLACSRFLNVFPRKKVLSPKKGDSHKGQDPVSTPGEAVLQPSFSIV